MASLAAAMDKYISTAVYDSMYLESNRTRCYSHSEPNGSSNTDTVCHGTPCMKYVFIWVNMISTALNRI